LDKIYVKKGEKVGANTGPNGTAKVVGLSGNTGLSGGPHLHLDYAKAYNPSDASVSNTMNPMSFIKARGLVKGTNVKATGQTRVSTPPPASSPRTTSSSSGANVGPWGPLLNLIASKESGGNYEAMAPGRTLPGATKMTIAEVTGRATGAVGKYQQLPEYLVGRAKNAGLDPNKDLYSPANQDLIAAKVNIGMNRGGNKWLQGGLSDEVFMQRLAMEFAVLPNAQGQFYHSGQGSSITAAQFRSVLRQVKGGGTSQAKVSSSPRSNTSQPAQTQPAQVSSPSGSNTSQPAQTQLAKVSPSPGSNTSQQITQERQPQQFFVPMPMPTNQSTPQPPPRSSGGGGVSSGGEEQENILDRIINSLLIR